MKPRSLVIPGTRYRVAADGTISEVAMNARYFSLACTPTSGLNPGDGSTPTNWAYTLLAEKLFTCQTNANKYAGCGNLGYITAYLHGVNYNGTGKVNPPVDWDRSRLYNEALSRLNEKTRVHAEWSEDIARASQTTKLFNVIDAATDLFTTARRNPLGIPKAIGSGYLQFRYGWQPLLGNIYDTAIVLADKATNTGLTFKASATERIKLQKMVDNANAFTYTATGYPSAKPIKHVESGKQGCRISVNLKGASGPNFTDFTTLNPWLLGWNLIPYSFVVDWFYNIGGYMEAIETAFRFKAQFVSGYKSELYVNRTVESATKFCGGYQRKTAVLDLHGSRRDVRFVRTVLNSYPLPSEPRLNLDLGSSRLLAAAALLTTLFSSSPGPKPGRIPRVGRQTKRQHAFLVR